MQPYKPSGRVPLTWIIWLVMVIVGAMVWGIIVSIISQFVYLVILFPLGMGAVGGIMLARTIQTSKMRNPMVASLCGIVVALTIYGSLHYYDYLFFRKDLEPIVSQKVANADLVDPAIDMIIETETGLPGFWGYLVWAAREGVSIGHLGVSSLFTFSGPFTVLYWLAEFGIIAYLTASVASFQAKQPFSEKQNQWYPGGRLLGSIVDSKAAEFLRLVQAGDLLRIGEMIEDAPLPNISFYLQSFDLPSDDSIFSACRVSARGSKDLLEGVLSPSQTAALKRGIAERKSSQTALSQPRISDVMQAYADLAVDSARQQFRTELDFSEGSLEQVEHILVDLYSGLPESERHEALQPGPARDRIWQMAKIWGSYVGEVIRRQWGGEWTTETAAQPGVGLTLRVLGSDIFPTAKVYKRLVNGAEDNVWHYYQLLKQDWAHETPSRG